MQGVCSPDHTLVDGWHGFRTYEWKFARRGVPWRAVWLG